MKVLQITVENYVHVELLVAIKLYIVSQHFTKELKRIENQI